MIGLDQLSFKAVLFIAYQKSGKTYEQIANESNIPLSAIKKYFNPNEEYHPRPDHIITLSKVLNTTLLVDWFVAHVKVEQNHNLLPHLITKELTDVINEMMKALEDGELTLFERQKLVKEVKEAKEILDKLEKALINGEFK
ncbi:helix-turn-helix transcriptional regulator [Persephonella sp.]|uniref:helix-turn-helix transcriptional regulator n=1 Tax=Persephonella sp. TaxID=2060922 RepID=UPI00262C725B|nr:helix-turn-helix transcriptional regulator [Persephonella sp.]